MGRGRPLTGILQVTKQPLGNPCQTSLLKSRRADTTIIHVDKHSDWRSVAKHLRNVRQAGVEEQRRQNTSLRHSVRNYSLLGRNLPQTDMNKPVVEKGMNEIQVPATPTARSWLRIVVCRREWYAFEIFIRVASVDRTSSLLCSMWFSRPKMLSCVHKRRRKAVLHEGSFHLHLRT